MAYIFIIDDLFVLIKIIIFNLIVSRNNYTVKNTYYTNLFLFLSHCSETYIIFVRENYKLRQMLKQHRK